MSQIRRRPFWTTAPMARVAGISGGEDGIEDMGATRFYVDEGEKPKDVGESEGTPHEEDPEYPERATQSYVDEGEEPEDVGESEGTRHEEYPEDPEGATQSYVDEGEEPEDVGESEGTSHEEYPEDPEGATQSYVDEGEEPEDVGESEGTSHEEDRGEDMEPEYPERATQDDLELVDEPRADALPAEYDPEAVPLDAQWIVLERSDIEDAIAMEQSDEIDSIRAALRVYDRWWLAEDADYHATTEEERLHRQYSELMGTPGRVGTDQLMRLLLAQRWIERRRPSAEEVDAAKDVIIELGAEISWQWQLTRGAWEAFGVFGDVLDAAGITNELPLGLGVSLEAEEEAEEEAPEPDFGEEETSEPELRGGGDV